MRKGTFDLMPNVRFNRSKFSLGHGVKTSMSMGKLYPLDIQEVLPGDSFKCSTTAVARLTSAFFKPVVDNAFMDIYHFYVPLRLLYSDNERVFGNPNPSAYIDNDLGAFPVFDKLVGESKTYETVSEGTVADYLGLPLGDIPQGCSVLPFRAFAKVYNEWFRNENAVDEMYVQTGEFKASEHLNNNAWSPNNYTGKLPNVSKKRDYFTSCLPQPQKGQASAIPLTIGNLPLVGSVNVPQLEVLPEIRRTMDTPVVGNFVGGGGALEDPVTSTYFQASGSFPKTGRIDLFTQGTPIVNFNAGSYASGSGATADVTVNDMRLAFQLQKMLEKDARYGSTYREYLYGHYGVTSPDSRLQYTEYLGGGRIPITVQQVAQTSSSTNDSNLADLAGYSLSNGKSYFNKGFVEHGYVLTVACIRQLHTYQQGIPKLFMRSVREDFYDPLLANLGEQPVWKQELFADKTKGLKEVPFGYNEAWAEYRYAPSRVSGQMRSDNSATLDMWHFADDYASAPVYGQSFVEETSTFFDRTLAIGSQSQDNFLLDLWFDMSAIRVMPTYSVPGLIDHH